MAVNAGEVYFSAMLKMAEAEKQAAEFKKRRHKIYFDTIFKTGGIAGQAQKAAIAASKNAKIQAQMELNSQNVRKKVAQAAKAAESAAKIEASIKVNSAGFKKQIGTLGVAAGTTIGNAVSGAMGTALNGLNKITSTGLGFATNSVKAYSDVQATLTRVQAKANLKIEEAEPLMAALNTKMLEVAGSSALSVSDMAQLSETAIQAGRSLSEITDLLDPVSQGSSALGRSGAELVGDLSVYMDTYQVAATDAQLILEKINATSQSANTNANELAEGLNYFKSAIPGIQGVNQQLSVQSILAKGGLTSTRAGTAATALFTQANKKASDVLKDFGVKIKDSEGNLRGEADVLKELGLAYKRISEERGTAAAAALANSNFGIQGARAVGVAAKLTEKQLTDAINGIAIAGSEGNKTLQALADKALTGLAGAKIQIDNALGAIQQQLGKALSEPLAAVGQEFASILGAINANTGAFEILGSAGKQFAEALSGAKIELKFVSDQIGELIGTYLIELATYVDNIATKLRENPEIIKQIGDRVVGIIKFFVELGQVVAASFSVVASVLTGFFSGFSQGMSGAQADTGGLVNVIERVGEALGLLAQPIGFVSGLLVSLLIKATQLADGITSALSFESFSLDVDEGSGLGQIISQVTEFQQSVQNAFGGEFIASIGSQFQTFIGGVAQGIQGLIDSFVGALQPAIAPFLANVQSALPGISALISKIVEWIVSSLPSFQAIATFVGTVLGNGASLLLNIVGNLIKVGGWLAQIIADNQILDGAIKGIQGTVTLVFNILTGLSNVITTIQGAIYNFIIPAAGLILTAVGNIGNLLSGAILLPFQAIQALFGDTQALADNFLVKTLAGFATKIAEIEVAILNAINSAIASALAKWNEFTTSISNWFSSNLSALIEGVSTSLNNFWASELAKWDALKANILSGFGDFTGWFTDTLPSILAGFWATELQKWNDTKENIRNSLNEFVAFFVEVLPGAIAGTWTSLTEGFENVKATVGNFFGGTLLSFFTTGLPEASASLYQAETARFFGFADSITGWFSNTFLPFFLETIPQAIASLISTAETYISTFWGTIQSYFSLVQTYLVENIPQAIATLQGLAEAYIQNYWNVVQGYFGLVQAFFTEVIPNLFSSLITLAENYVTNYWNFVQAYFSLVKSFFSETIPSVLETLKGLAEAYVTNYWNFVQNYFNTLRSIITETIPSYIEQLQQYIRDRTSQIWEYFLSLHEQVKDMIVTQLPQFVSTLMQFVRDRLQQVYDFYYGLYESVRNIILVTLPEIISQLQQIIVDRLQTIFTRFQGYYETVVNYLTVTLPQYARDLIQTATDLIVSLWGRIMEFWDRGVNIITVQLPQYVRSLIQLATEQIVNLWGRILEYYELLKSFIQVQIPNYFRELIAIATAQVESLWQRVLEFYNQVREFLTQTIPGYISDLKDRAIAFIQEVVNKIEQFFTDIRIFITETVPGYVTDLAGNITGKIGEIGTSITDKIKAPIDGVADVFTNITNSSKSIMDNISGWGDNVGSFISDFGQNAWDSLLGAFGGGTGQGGQSPLLSFLGGDITADQLYGQFGFGSGSGGINDAAAKALAAKYFGNVTKGTNEGIFEAAGVSQAVIDLIKSAEGYYAKAYFDPNLPDKFNLLGRGTSSRGSYSGGFGTFARSTTEVISVEEANRRLLDEVLKAEREVNALAKRYGYDFNKNQLSALVSLAYNGGIGMVSEITRAGTRTIEEISNIIPRYNKSGNRTLLGLTRRREVEKALFDASPVSVNLDTTGVLTGAFGQYRTNTIPGQDYFAPRGGGRRHAGQDFLRVQDAKAFFGGRVIATGNDPGGYDKWVDVLSSINGKQYVQRFAEMTNLLVKTGDFVKQGQTIATGINPRTNVLHYEVRDYDRYLQGQKFGVTNTRDPLQFLESTGLFNYNNSSGILSANKNAFGGASDALLETFENMQAISSDHTHSASEHVHAVGTASEKLHQFSEQLSQALYGATVSPETAPTATSTVPATNLTQPIQDATVAVGEVIAEAQPLATDMIGEYLMQAVDYLSHMDEDLHTISSFFRKADELLENILDWAGTITQPIREGYKQAKSQVNQLYRKVAEPLGRVVESGNNKLGGYLGKMGSEIVNIEKIIDPEFLNALLGVRKEINPTLSGIVENLARTIDPEVLRALTGNTSSSIAGSVQAVKQEINPTLSGIVENLARTIDPAVLKALTGNSRNSIAETVLGVQNAIDPQLTNLIDPELLNQLGGINTSLDPNLVNSITSALLTQAGIQTQAQESATGKLIRAIAEQSGIDTTGITFDQAGTETILNEIASATGKGYNEIVGDITKQIGEANLTATETQQQQLTEGQQALVNATKLQIELAQAQLNAIRDPQGVIEAKKQILINNQLLDKNFRTQATDLISQIGLVNNGLLEGDVDALSAALQDALNNRLTASIPDYSLGNSLNRQLNVLFNANSNGAVSSGFSGSASTVSGAGSQFGAASSNRGNLNISFNTTGNGGFISSEEVEQKIRQLWDYVNSPDFIAPIAIAGLEILRRDPAARSQVLG